MRSILTVSVLALLVAACGTKPENTFGDAGPGGGDDGGVVPDPDGGSDPFADSGYNADGATPPACSPNPANFDVPGNGCDDDGDGTVDNGYDCDKGFAATGPAADMAKAIGLCKTATNGSWGVVSATYTNGYQSATAPATEQHGILPKFGSVLKPRQGSTLGALSSGWAREYDGTATEVFKGGKSMQSGAGAAPPGFPKDSPACPNTSTNKTVNDVATLKLVIKVPANVKGFAFDFNFFSGEWPEFVCTTFNDAFIAFLKSAAFNNGTADNISFDSKKNPVSVNNGFFDRCSPKALSCFNFPPNYQACNGGDAELKGTGFYDPADNCGTGNNDSGGGGTGWLTTMAPVQANETMTLEFMIWDTGDHIYDSSVLVDNWTWQTTDTAVGTSRPPN